MELGTGFLIGALAGTVIALIAATIIAVSRKAVKSGKTQIVTPPPAETPPTTPARSTAVVVRQPHARRTATTMVIEPVDSRDIQLGRNIQEVRDLLLRLADVVSCADTASDRAAKAFGAAKSTIDNLEIGADDDLVEAQRILVNEIDRIIRSNATLHNELDKAHQGIDEQRRQIEELRIQARIDGLTRIPNRAAFDERLKEYISLLDRTRLAFSLLMLDIDLFKQVNDEHGHINGDRVLRGVAAKIADSVRGNDFAARYGGEEFAVLFPGSGLDEALAVAERIRADVAKTNFRLDDKTIKITVSGGIAECKQGMDGDALLKNADSALYEAKNSGRNAIRAAR